MASLLLMVSVSVAAQEQSGKSTVLPDSSNFVTASIIVISPGSQIYSVFGHCALRMECPSQGLDVCMSVETDPDILNFILGRTRTKFVSVETNEYLSHYREEGRSIEQCVLNLSASEKQELGRKLYYEIENSTAHSFDMKHNCLSTLISLIESVMVNEQIEFQGLPEELDQDNGNALRAYTNCYPWYQFVFVMLAGNDMDDKYDLEYRLSPQTFPSILQNAKIKNLNTGEMRNAMIGDIRTIYNGSYSPTNILFSPFIVFGLLLLYVIVITVWELLGGVKFLPEITDTILLLFQTLVGLLLMWTTFVSNLFDSWWNWYLIPFNVVPITLWLFFRKKRKFGEVYLVYAVILLLFVIMTPFSSQLDWSHQFISLSFMVRCINKFAKYKLSLK
jgi:hypothetical protein